jgi:hypothetical protein
MPQASEMEQLRELVMTTWDPIGVHLPENGPEERALYWNEYDDYLPTIRARLDAGEDIDWLVSNLTHIRTELMGLSPRPDLDQAAARAIVDWHRRIRP